MIASSDAWVNSGWPLVQILDRAVLAYHDEYSNRPLNSSRLSDGWVNGFNSMRDHFLGYFFRKPDRDESPRGFSPSGFRDGTRFIEIDERKWQVRPNFRGEPFLRYGLNFHCFAA